MKIEVNTKALVAKDQFETSNRHLVLVTPPLDENFWLMRVPLSEKQAIVIFPKFCLIGCGFQRETDWNTNLPLSCSAEKIFGHIKHNKGDDNIRDEDCIEAIKLLQSEVEKLKAKPSVEVTEF